MKTSRIQILRHLTMVALALGIALLNVGSTMPVALGYVDGPVSAPVARDRLAENAVNGLQQEESRSATVLAATFDVACGDVYGPSGLIAAIGEANGNLEDDVINLAADCVYILIAQDNDTDGPNGLPSVLTDGGHRVTINGNGAAIERSTVFGIPAFRIFHVSSGGDLILNDLTVKNGRTLTEAGGGIYNAGALTLNDSTVRDNTTGDGDDTVGGDAGDGGGVYNAADAHLTLTSSTVSDNATGAGGDQVASAQTGRAGHGGGIYSSGTVTVTNSTVSGNATGPGGDGLTVPGGDGGYGAGIYNVDTLTLSSSTVVSNTTGAGGSGSSAGDAGSGGGISNSGAVTVTNTIIANNAVASGGAGPDCQGALSSQDYNLIESTSDCTIGGVTAHNITGQDPQIGPLRDGGGSTETHALLSGSPAIDDGSDADCPAADQRGVARPQDGDDNGASTCDIGAYERGYVPLWTVTTTADDFGTIDDACSLREAIQALNTNQDFGGCRIDAGNHTITLAAGTYALTIAGSGEDANASGDLDITSDLVINGAGADTTFIDANYLDRVLHVHSGATVELRNVTLTDGLTPANGPGGGVYNAGSLTITSSQVVSNTTGFGASSVGGDGGDGAHGGGIYNTGQLTLTNNSFVRGNITGLGGLSTGGNGGAGGHGGGIYNAGQLTVAVSVVEDNATGAGGIAIRVTETITGGAGGSGGGIYNTGQLTVTNNSFVRGNITGPGGIGTSGNGGDGGSGGGIYNTGQLISDNGSITENTTGAGGDATSGSGGDGGLGGGICSTGQVTVTNNSLVGENTTGAGGTGDAHDGGGGAGGIYNDEGAMTVNDSTVSSNSFGGIVNDNGTLTVTSSTVSNNSGGGIGNFEGTLTVTSSTVSNNSTEYDGGGICNWAGTVTVSNSTVSNNSAGGAGGGIGNYGDLTVATSTVSDNNAGSGGGISNRGTASITDSTISGNSATHGGGGISNFQGTLTLNNSTVSDNDAERGGGIYNLFATMSITDSIVSNNSAEGEGGGINNYMAGTMTVTDSTVSDNSAEGYGGGIFNEYSATLAVTNSTVRNNSAGYGGGISNDGDIAANGAMTVTQTTVVNNSADFEGGGIRNSGTMALINSTISTNSANWGGGIYDRFGNVDVRFTTIAGNSAVQEGASVYNGAGNVTLLATIIAEPQGKPNCAGDGLTSTGGGFNRISDTSCQLQNADPDNDKENAVIQLLPLDDYGGPTLTHKPVADLDNEVVDIMPGALCLQAFDPDEAVDQRGKHRPSIGVRVEGVFVSPDDAPCDAGAVELRTRVQRVCGPPLAHTNDAGEFVVEPEFVGRCFWPTIAYALQQAEEGDTIIVSGTVSETVTVDKSVTIEGPTREEITPGTHMGIVQADLDQPDGSRTRGSVFTIPEGISVTIKNLNIRHGDAGMGGGINNSGLLTLEGVTIYDNAANWGGAIYNSGALTVENSSLLDNLGENGGAGIYNAAAGTARVTHATLADNIIPGWTARTIPGMPDDDDLALWLPFDESSGATEFADESGHGRNGSCSSPHCPTAGANGHHGKALRFDGSDDYVEVPHSDGLNPAAMTIAAWIKADTWATEYWEGVVVSKDDWESDVRGYTLRTGENGRLSFALPIDGTWEQALSGQVMSTGTWVHVAGTYDGNTIKVFVNGTEQASTPASGSFVASSYPLNIGRSPYATNRLFDGTIDDVVIYNRALSEEEIELLYASSADGAYAVYAVDMDEDGDPDVFSASYNDDKIAWYENAGTGNGSAWVPHIISTAADGARSVYVADVDGDGDLDALSASYNDDKIAWYENTDGDGTAWTSHTIVDVNSIPDSNRADGAMSVFAVDVDGDDDTDVLSASENDDKIAWYENRLDDVGCTPSTPALCWIPHTISTAANGAQSVYAADVDEDGNVDVFSASYNDNKIVWYENKLDDPGCTLLAPAACWSAHTISIAANGARSVYAADVDGDGDLDALSASQNDDKIAWYENTSGDGAAWTTHIIVDTHSGADRADGARSVYAADVDRDGDLDALSASYDDDKIAWYENTDGDGTAWTAHTISTDADGARSVFAAFVDEDGNVDVLSALYDDDEITWYDNPIGAIGSSIYNANPAADSVTVSGTILQSAGLAENQCWGEVTTGGYNLLHGGTCFTLGGTDISGDPELGPLRDNGGPTLTRALSTADSPAVEAGPFEADCAVETDQRGKTRPFDSPGGGGVRCDIGAVEYGADTLLVCETCNPDPDNLRFTDLQEALHRAMAGDVIAVEAGAYTGSFTAYKNATLQHAGINVATLSQDQPVGVRAILQASERTIREQHRLLDETQTDGLSGTVLTIEAYEYPAGPAGAIAVTDDVTVTLRGLTIRHGLSRQGGGIYNVGHLYVYTSTISENAVVNGLQGATVVTEAMGGAIYNVGDLTLERSTLSGNQSEYYGGAIYNDGSGSGGIPATVEVDFSTIAENRAEKIGAQRVVNIKDAGFDPGTLTVDSGDHIQFQDQTANAHTLVVDGEGCNLAEIEVPRQGGGLSEPLICSVSDDPVTITVRDKDNASLSMNITVNALGFTPEAHAIYVSGGEITVHRSLLVKSSGSSGDNCGFGGMGSLIQSEGYNLVDDDSCRLTGGTDLRPATEPNLAARLGPLQDNNAIDFVNNWISGYTYSHALKPGSSAMDHIPPDECGAATQHTINIASGSLDLTIEAGDVVKWTHTADSTVALDDGEANVNLVAVPAGGQSREVQFTEPGDYPYRVYANDTRAQIGAGVIEVASRVRAVDQRGTVLPQRGTGDTYRCDVGAYEFEPWIVGQPLSRPPAAIGTQPPSWEDGKGTELGLSYHAWSSATAQDYPLRPSPNDGDADLEESEIVTLKWETDPDPASQVEMALYGIVEWPADPQIHVSEAPAQLTHDDVSDGFQVSDARAFEGREPADDEAGQLLSVGVFARTVLPDIAGDSYSVLQFVKGNQANPTLKVQVVKTVDWNTPGVRDMRAERGVCEIGHEIRYRSYEDASGTLPGHEDPEDRPGQILLGEAFDGVRTEIDLARVQNTVDGLILPAHIRDAREGPIIPILNTAPTQLSGDLVTGDHDLRITWYRPDERDVAWPVKTIGYRCDWPADPPEIVIASELGSEIGGQAVLNLEGYSDVTVYHQPDPDEPGYNPNDEHALLASSNLGNSAPALYALRTDLADQPYALLKYRDPREDDQPKIAVYKVVLTREAEEITNITPDPGTITLLASASAAGVAQTNLQSQPSVTVRVGDGELPPGGDVTVLVEALGASNLRSATIKVSYDPDVLTPTACATNRLDSVEALYNLQITTDEPQQPFRTVHMRASLNAGTDAQYEWDFDDGTTRIAGAEVSHVYGAVGTYTVTVTASNGVFADVTATTQIEIAEDAVPGSLDDDDTIGCRIETDGELTIELKTRNKHGLSGNLTLTEVTFEATGDPPAEDTETSLDLTSISLFGPGYEDLSFNITAGNPVFAPTPLRGLLDIQPCPQTKATDVAARPFWRDFKDMLWARAAGDMDMLYFYPLQPGFHLTDDHAESLGLVDENGNVLSPDDRVGRCVPWMDELSGGQTETVPYAIPHTITTDADGARSVHAADVDGDGDVDVLSASFDDDTIAWYENTDGAGTFGPEQVITTDADGATSVYAADVDDDGDLDVLSASANDDKIAWYENDGTPANGGWIAHTLVTGADGARSVYAADADGDGNLDVLSASENNDRITWYENFDGDGWFYRSQVIADDADGARSVYAADVDDDGDVDVVSASFNDDKIAWYENQLNGFGCGPPWDTGECWTAHIISTNAGGATSVYAADVDGDDDVDILSASENDDKIAWYENTDGAGAFGPEQVITTDANGAVSVYAADVDGDGDLDALSASYYGDEIAWYENDGTPADGGWTAHTLSTDADGARSVYAADVDGDDDLDVLSASENDDKIAWYQNQSVRVLPVAYHADWPDLPPLLSVGETVYERAKSGISGVANQLAVSRIYDDLAPGAWDNDAAKIVIEGAEVQRSLAELIDPIGEARVEVGITINDNPALPEEIKTDRLLFGGGLAIVGTTDNEITLPFALRSRITFDDIEGDLIFRGYYDGASPEYIKGDPLLLLNVMSKSDKQRLEDLCQSGSADCQKYLDAIEELYHKTRNPRQVDLCRTADGELYVDDPDPADNQGAEDAAISTACQELGDGTATYRDGEPDHALLIGVQDANDDGLPEPYEGLGKGKALSAGNAAGTGYITLVYNNDDSLGGLPVSLQVIKVGCTKNHLGEDSTYRGNLLVVKSDNLFDEKLTLRHTGDFGGQPDNFEFEWYIAEVDETAVSPTQLPPSYPWKKWTRLEPGADDIGPEITIEGANPTTLSDNWLIMRYKGCPVCGNQYRYSAFAGDPSAKPSEVRGQLAEGWIKRVVGALNPFDTRVDDFVSTPVNTAVDMIRQAGPRYEGPVAMSNDPDVLNSMGLIEAYQTVLDRGRDLSIDSNINHQGANAALMNVTSRIGGLYMLLGNEAYMDALDPTVGLGTSSALDSRAPAIFAFMNQFRPDAFGLIDEELGLLRGRDETLGGVAAAPTYNRLTWNFTNGDGEVAYVMNYNIKDMNQDGFVNEADAAIMYPQGHGDAWGHHLTAITKYYELLRHPNYTWAPRAEPVSVGGAPVVVDYYDERRFATAAGAKARMGAEIVDLTYRQHYSDPDDQEYVDSHVDSSDDRRRAWGVADWARRAGQGAYFDWVMANAIIPPEDDRYSDVRKIDRTTVLEIGEIADQYRNIQGTLDSVDQGLNPLGLAGDAVLFDLDPSLIAGGVTHFEQVYERALNSLGNTLTLFDYANEVKLAQRASQDARRDFVTTIIEKDTALINQLIELFGYPYDADIGVNGTYPEGYDGPDIYNYDLWDRIELTDHEKRCSDEEVEYGRCDAELTTFTVEYWPLDCLGNYVEYLKDEDRAHLNEDLICPHVNRADEGSDKLEIEYTVGVGLDKGRGRFKPASWPEDSARKAVGDVQNAIQSLNQARLEYEMAIQVYQNHVIKLDATQKKIKERADMLKKKEDVKISTFVTFKVVDAVIAAAKEWALVSKKAAMITDEAAKRAQHCPPAVAGFSNDLTSGIRCGIYLSGLVSSSPMRASEFVAETIQNFAPLGKDIIQGSLEIDLFKDENDWEIKNMGRALGGLLLQEKELRLALYLAKDKVNGAQGDYDQTLQRAFRKLQELIRLRKRWAGQISEQRYSDMAYRIFQNDALQKYRRQFDLAQTYTYLTAAAYDYEVNLSRDDPAMGDQFLRQIVGARTLGEVRRFIPLPLDPIVGSGGLADPLGRMKDNFEVLKGQMGFNNPQTQASRFSLRHELLRLRDSSDAKWRHELQRYYTPDIYSHDDVARLAKRPYGETGPQPGLVIPFGTNVTQGFNFFGRPLGPDDGAYNATQFVTKIASVGVWFEGYDTERLARMPYVYLLPAGNDVIRPRDTSGLLRYWNITEQLLPLPHTIGQADMEDPTWIPRHDGLDGQLFAIKPYASFQAFPYSDTLTPSELNTDTRLIGRSVWNTEWVLIIPGATLLFDPQMGLERFIEDVDDVYVYFQTYAYAGN